MARARGNGTGSVTPYKDSKGKKKYRVRVTAGVVYDEEKSKFKYTSKSLGVYNTKAEAEKVLAEYNESPYDLTNKVKTVKDLYDEWSIQYFSNIAPSAVRSVKSAWAYCEDIYNLPLQKLSGVAKLKPERLLSILSCVSSQCLILCSIMLLVID